MRSHEQKEREKEKTSKYAYQGRIVSLKLLTYESGKTFEIVEHGGAVVILPILPDGRVLLIQQWRRAVGKIIIELPAGILEKGEDPLNCAKRELQEETGYVAGKMTSLGGFYSTPGFCDEYLHLYLAEDLTSKPLPVDEEELIDPLPLTLKETKHLIETNQICDAKTVAGILRYMAR